MLGPGSPRGLLAAFVALPALVLLALLVRGRELHPAPARIELESRNPGREVSVQATEPSSIARAPPATQADAAPFSGALLNMSFPSTFVNTPVGTAPAPPLAQPSPLPSPPPPRPPHDPAAPWTAPPDTHFAWEGLHDNLTALLAVRANPERWVSLITMTGSIKRFVLNCVYSLHKYGGWPYYILVTYDPSSLEVCRGLRLPCFDGSAFAKGQISDVQGHAYGSEQAVAIWWAKQRTSMELIRRGYNVHGSDADVVYLRNVSLSYGRAFEKTNADGIFATEEWYLNSEHTLINFINAGVYAIRSNPRSLRFFERWTEHAAHGGGGIDQNALNSLAYKDFFFCDTRLSCDYVQRIAGKFAVFRHRTFFPDRACIYTSLNPTPCDTRRLYLHQICIYGWEAKRDKWTALDLWFIDEDLKPMWADGGGPKGNHAFLPCQEQTAWPELESGEQ